MGDPWLVCCTVQREPRSGWLTPLPTVGSGEFWVLCWGWGSFFVSVFGGSRLGRCQSTSRHGTCRWCSTCALMHWQSTQCSPLIGTNNCSCSTDIAYSCWHILNGTSCCSPHGQVNCPADTVPSYKWRNWNCHQTLEKACHKLRGIPEVPPQRITDLDNATRQLHQLSCILDSCTISASYEVSEAQKNLSCLWAPSLLLSFHLRSGFTPRFTVFNSQLSFCHMAVSLLAFGGLCRSNLWECCPRGSHSVISRLLAGGSLGFRIVLLLLHGSQIAVWHFRCVLFALVLFCHTNPRGDTMLSSLLIRFRWLWTDQLITGRAVFALCLVLCCLGCVFFVLLCVFLFVCFALVGCPCTVKAQWIMYRSLFSSSFGALCRYDDVATALIHWICKYATGFPACLTTWREPYGVGRKKKELLTNLRETLEHVLVLEMFQRFSNTQTYLNKQTMSWWKDFLWRHVFLIVFVKLTERCQQATPHLFCVKEWHVNKNHNMSRDISLVLFVCCKSGWALGSIDLVAWTVFCLRGLWAPC